MTYQGSVLETPRSTPKSNEKIRIADSSLAPIAGKGQIVLFDGFSLQNVLHVPKLSSNLLSISKITCELHYKATFLPESVCFQDKSSGRMIGTARHSRGLYILDDDTSSSSKTTYNNKVEQGHTGKIDKYDPSLDLPIALRKGTRSCTKHSISNYVSYENLSPQFRAFTTSLDSTTIPKNIHIALECFEWKNVVMEEMKALEKNNTWEICALPKGHKAVGCKWVYSDLWYCLFKNFSPVAKLNTVKDLSVAVNKDWPLNQLDFKNAFLNGGLVEEVYMSPPPSFEAQFGQHIKYTLELLTKTGMFGCHPADTPIEFNCTLGNSDDQVPIDKDKYQRLVGKLNHLSHTRPDISFIVSVVSQFIQAPYEEHMEAIKRILRYLKTTPGTGLMFRKTDRKTIEAYTYSNWVGSVVDR
uniref:Reverse transcriptase n=1 Tax=Cucumis melo subsp. melo TaxID=412675 RepID=E5GC16_CUCME|nr:reverse transcriptase [Cucumis melo subsp. melo]